MAGPDDDVEAVEHRLLIDPARDGAAVEEWFVVDVLDAKCRVIPAPSGAPGHPMRERVERTAALFTLNSPDALRPRIRLRNEVIDLHKAGDRQTLRRLAGRYQPWSSTALEALRTFAPRFPLPSHEDDLRLLLEQMLERIDLGMRMHQLGVLDDVGRRSLVLLQWTLAWLWADPPTGDTSVVERWLDANNLRPWVEPLRDRLLATPSP